LFSIARLGVTLLAVAGVCAAADTPLWEPGGTVDVGNNRFDVRPMQTPGALYLLSQGDNQYLDPQLTAPSSIEVAILSAKAVRLRTNGGKELYAMVESQKLLSAPPSHPLAPGTSAARVVLLEDGDFRDLEVQDIQSQDIGDGAMLYSFTGASSPARVGSNRPLLLVMTDHEAAMPTNVERSRLQIGQGTRQIVYSPSKKRSASSIPVTVCRCPPLFGNSSERTDGAR